MEVNCSSWPVFSAHYGLSQCRLGSWWPDCSVTITGAGKGEPKSTRTKQSSCKGRSVYLVQKKRAESKPGDQNKANKSDKGQAGIRSPRKVKQGQNKKAELELLESLVKYNTRQSGRDQVKVYSIV